MWRIISSCALLLLISCGSEKEKTESMVNNNAITETENGRPEIAFSMTSYDFGKISEGEVVGVNFNFVNSGNSNLIILDASASCGCTIPKWSKEPIPPRGKGTLEVIFDSSGRSGKQNKSVSVKTNASDQNIVLFIKAEIKPEK
jgi:hypothetical protein